MLEYLLDGGPLMLPLVLLSILSLAIIIDRWRAFVQATADTDAVRDGVMKSLDRNDVAGAIEICKNSTGPLAAVTLAGLDKYRRMALHGADALEMETVVAKLMEDYTPRAVAGLEKRFNLLALIGTVAPLLGMTGTVTGMIKSFGSFAQAESSNMAATVGAGISEALLTTASGLLVAIPALVAYNLFSRRADTYLLTIEEMIGCTVNYISERARGITTAE